MKSVDFFWVDPKHEVIHKRLLNWARWVRPRSPFYQHPMWRQTMSNARQWHAPLVNTPINTLEAMETERQVSKLPTAEREAIRWCYVHCGAPYKVCKRLGVSQQGLNNLIRNGREMLLNTTGGALHKELEFA